MNQRFLLALIPLLILAPLTANAQNNSSNVFGLGNASNVFGNITKQMHNIFDNMNKTITPEQCAIARHVMMGLPTTTDSQNISSPDFGKTVFKATMQTVVRHCVEGGK